MFIMGQGLSSTKVEFNIIAYIRQYLTCNKISVVERRVVSQLALAHETQQLSSGCVVRLYTSTMQQETGNSGNSTLR